MNVKALSVSSLALLVLSACQLAPQQQAIELPVPHNYALVSEEAGVKAAELHWQQFFSNPKLQQLIELSLTQNKDLQIAALNVQRVRALYQIEDSALYPALNLNASGTRQHLPAGLTGTGSAQINQQYSATLGITSYELDFWGKVRNQSEQALQQLYATEQAQLSSQISLVAELANAWLSYAADQQLLELATHTLHSQQKTLELTEQSYHLGAASALTLQQVKSTVATAKVDIARYQRLLQRDKNALDLLTGVQVSADLLPDQPLSKVVQLPELPAGLPSDLLQQRPDLKAAEHDLLAANANIGIAKAAFFPSISLTANAGSASGELDNLFKGGSGSWSFMPSIHLPIFNMGRTQANLDVAETQQQVALVTYQQKIQQAFREVSDALADREGYAAQLQAQQDLANSNQQSFSLSEARFKQGVDSYLQVLDAQRSWYSAQQQLISGQHALLASQISLYKVLGGGWQSNTSPVE
ncbi:MAG: efflux transporter outer membrane subunit [Gammaproteobacteria bacterium]|nr:efflux transporter outer membrane subunit [Gammaproteobacteria bacterium]MBU2057007.1 efflux transporter outer membrane subunit [Gammaproteobacteria bacterium]MBU2174461.1 efflux transporter outer membrane subunit [Gammaproteobacteria bacterium]MBU2248153.1 efflux transporter outer membrane subunit [Gammaproteobacteria bacterium]MBU2345317.1 efflux transporter outer membrane subunit [Gammaproteobacteria bacterium]